MQAEVHARFTSRLPRARVKDLAAQCFLHASPTSLLDDPSRHMRTDASFRKVVRRGVLLIGLLGALPTTFPAAAQTDRTAPATRAGEGLYTRIGIGFGDYTGDLGSSSFGDAHSHPLDIQGFVWGLPYYGSGETA
jgi:hypothetical protein